MAAKVPNIDTGQTLDHGGTDLFAVDSSKDDSVNHIMSMLV